MRPLRLTMTAFGPYAGTEAVDFDGLTELGLFVVAGNNGAGKTTIFDALHYSLFGTLPGRRATYIRLRSDHAPPNVACAVVLDFVAKGQQWRVERSPKQQRPKRRGTGVTEVERQATLYRLDDNQPVAIANRILEVDQLCRELVGLSGPQFERVALLPQGEFSRVLSQSGSERRELLRALFSSEVFGDATSLLNDRAAASLAAEQHERERTELQLDAIADELAVVCGAQPLDRSAASLLQLLRHFKGDELGKLEAHVASLSEQASAASRAEQTAIEVSHRINRREDVRHKLATHQTHQQQHERDCARLAQARAAVPVASQARTTHQQHQRVSETFAHANGVLNQANRALAVAGTAHLSPRLTELEPRHIEQTLLDLDTITSKLDERRAAAGRADDLDAAVKRLQGDLRRQTNDITSVKDRLRIAQTHLRQATNELKHLNNTVDVEQCEHQLRLSSDQLGQCVELHTCDQEAADLEQRVGEQEHRVEQIRDAHEHARLAQESHTRLQLDAQVAIDRLTESDRRMDACKQYTAASQRLVTLRTLFSRASTVADAQWDSFISGTAARIGETLVDDMACPVCGSCDHPAPAQPLPGDTLVNESDVAAAREHADTLQSELRRVEATIEALRLVDQDIAARTVDQLSEEITLAKGAALRTGDLANRAQQQAAQRDQLAAELAAAELALNESTAHRRVVDERRHNLRGALGTVADDPLEVVRERKAFAEQALAGVEQNIARVQELTGQLDDLSQTIETIGIELIACESRCASIGDQLAGRELESADALNTLAAIDAQLHTITPDSEPRDSEPRDSGTPDSGTPDSGTGDSGTGDMDTRNRAPQDNPRDADGSGPIGFEQRARAARHARELLTSLTTACALWRDAIDGERRADMILNDKLHQSIFDTVEQATAAFVDPEVVDQLEAQTKAYVTGRDQLLGQLQELTDLPDAAPDVQAATQRAADTTAMYEQHNHQLITTSSQLVRLEAELNTLIEQVAARQGADLEARRLERVAALVKGDNDRNTSLENWVLSAHLRDVVELANVRLARSTQQRFQLCVLADGENKRGRWGLDLGVEDTVTGTRRPTAGLSGGELFQASLALALGLADAVMNQTAGVHIDALFIDEGFGSLDETSVERAIDLLDELRDRGAMVGVITHVPALLEALPRGITVVSQPDGQGSTIHQAA